MTSAQGHNISLLLPKLDNADADYRYMGLEDLRKIFENLGPRELTNDINIGNRVIDGLLKTLKDSNGEVQNMAIKVLGPFVAKMPTRLTGPLMEQVIQLPTAGTVDNSIPALALREIIMALERPVPGQAVSKEAQTAYEAISHSLIPGLIGSRPDSKGMVQLDVELGRDSNSIDIVIELAKCFGSLLKEQDMQALEKCLELAINSDRAGAVLKKKAVTALATLSVFFSDAHLSWFISRLIEDFKDVHLTNSKQKYLIMTVGSIARSIPSKFGPYLKTLVPFVLSAVSEEEFEAGNSRDPDEEVDSEADDVRETALVALESFLVACPEDMKGYIDDATSAALRFLTYDPNVAQDVDMDEDFEDDASDLEGEDFEEEQGYDDEDDSSWKVRRCAAKTIHTLAVSRSYDLFADAALFDRVAPALVARFKEREESVRLEVLAALTALVRRTSENSTTRTNALRRTSTSDAPGPPFSRKRRRGMSDVAVVDTDYLLSPTTGTMTPTPEGPPTGPQVSLSKIAPEILSASIQLLGSSPIPTKQAALVLLKELVGACKREISSSLGQVIDPLVDTIKMATGSTSLGGSSAATTGTARLHALQLLGLIASAESAPVLKPQMEKVVPVLRETAMDRNGKASVEALRASDHVVRAVTSKHAGPEHFKDHLLTLFDLAYDRASSNSADAEVRQQAIQVLGSLLARTSGKSELLPSSKRIAGLQLIGQRLQNELLRPAAIKAVELIAALAQSETDLDADWVQEVALLLGSNFRKSSRSLRATSLVAVKKLATNSVSKNLLRSDTIKELEQMLLPLLSADDLHLLAPALHILAAFVERDVKTAATPELNKAICDVVRMTVTGAPLQALVSLARAIAVQRAAAPLMQELLQGVGVSGNAEILGKVTGTVLVNGGDTVGVKLDDFLKELNSKVDAKRQRLALSVLGESALLLGVNSPLKPSVFSAHFQSESDKVPLAAAVGLGRAGAGNIKQYVPVILEEMKKPDGPHYLLLHSVKEVLQHGEAEEEIRSYAQDLWQSLMSVSQSEDNKTIAAECVGRLAILEPQTFLPQLQSFVADNDEKTRFIAISALRFTFTDTDEAYDEHLQTSVVDMLKTMLNESNIENLRQALVTLNSAVNNKPQLVLPHLDQVLPLLMKETFVHPELIREVSMGPFKVKIDDGASTRQSAYETLFMLQETSLSRLPLGELENRIIAGFTDEHEILMLCSLMLTKLIQVETDGIRRRLEELASTFKGVLGQKLKETAVKTEIEKLAEAQKAVIKSTLAINNSVLGGGGELGKTRPDGVEDSGVQTWNAYVQQMKQEHGPLYKTVTS